MCGVSENTEKTDTLVSDTDITEIPIGSVSLITDTEPIGVSVMSVSVTIGAQ
jgi:hypothetical protein